MAVAYGLLDAAALVAGATVDIQDVFEDSMANPGGAIRAARQRLDAAQKMEDKRGEAVAALQVAIARFVSGETSDGLREARKALKLCRAVSARESEACALQVVAKMHLGLGEPEDASRALRDASAIFGELSLERGEAACCSIMAHVHLAGGAFQDAVEAATRASVMYERLGVERRTRALRCTILDPGKAGQLPAAASFDDARLEGVTDFEATITARSGELSRARDTGDKWAEALLMLQTAGARFEVVGTAALVQARGALILARELHACAWEAAALLLCARILSKKGDHDSARREAKAAHVVCTGLGSERAEAVAFGEIALIELNAGNFHEAVQSAEKAQALHVKLGSAAAESARQSVTLAQAFYALGDRDRAYATASLAVAAFEAVGDDRGVTRALQLRAEMLLASKEPGESLAVAQQALALSQKLGDTKMVQLAHHAVVSANLALDKREALRIAEGRVDELRGALVRRNFHPAARSELAGALKEVAVVHLDRGETRQAIEAAEDAKRVFQGLGDTEGAKAVLATAVQAQMRQHQGAEAAKLGKELGLLLLEAGDDAASAATAAMLHSIARARLDEEDALRALPMARAAMSIYEGLGDEYAEAQAKLTAGKAMKWLSTVGAAAVRGFLDHGDLGGFLAAFMPAVGIPKGPPERPPGYDPNAGPAWLAELPAVIEPQQPRGLAGGRGPLAGLS